MDTKLYYGKIRKAVHRLNQYDLERAVLAFLQQQPDWVKDDSMDVTVQFSDGKDGRTFSCDVTQKVVEIDERPPSAPIECGDFHC